MKSQRNFLRILLITSLLWGTFTTPARGEEVETAHSLFTMIQTLANHWGIEPTNPVLIAGVSVLAAKWGFGKVWGLRAMRAARIRAQSEFDVNTALIAHFRQIARRGGDQAATAELAATRLEQLNRHVQPCASTFPLLMWGSVGGAALLGGAGGFAYAMHAAGNKHKTIKQLQGEKTAEDLHKPLKQIELEEKIKDTEAVEKRVRPTADQVADRAVGFALSIRGNLLNDKVNVATKRQRTFVDHESDVKIAIANYSKPQLTLAFQVAVITALEETPHSHPSLESHLQHLVNLDKKDPAYIRFKRLTTRHFVTNSLPDIIKTEKHYEEFLKEETRTQFENVVDEALQKIARNY